MSSLDAKKQTVSVAGLGGVPVRPHPPYGPKFLGFMQFFGKFDKIVCWRPHRVGASSYRESAPAQS